VSTFDVTTNILPRWRGSAQHAAGAVNPVTSQPLARNEKKDEEPEDKARKQTTASKLHF